MALINKEKLIPVLEGYKKYFPSHWEDEKYKWEAVKHFQDNWDINAENFCDMFTKATEKTYNLLASGYAYPRGMIINFAQADENETREMFHVLYDEDLAIDERIQAFQKRSDELREQYDDGNWKNHYQNTNAITTYLWLMYPDKYYIYKYMEYREVAKVLSADYTPKKNGAVDNVLLGFEMYDEICKAIQEDPDIRRMLENALTDTCYSDPELKTATIDVGFYISRFYSDEQDDEWFPKDYSPNLSVDDWVDLLKDSSVFTAHSLQIMKRFDDYGGTATCKQLSVKYGETPNFYNNGSWSLAKRIAKKTGCRNAYGDDETGWWPILFLGRNAKQEEEGAYVWRLRKELAEAISMVDLSGVDLYAKPVEDRNINYWWLNANPKSWSFANLKIGEEEPFTLYNQNGNKRRIFQNFLDAKVGDLVIGYEAQPVKKVVALGVISQESDEKAIAFEKRESLTTPIDYQDLKSCPELSKMEFFTQPNGTLFKLTKGEYDFIMDIIREENPISQPDDEYEKYTKEDFLKTVFMSEERYDVLEALVRNKLNVILQGAPGVGKTFTAKKLAFAMMGEKDESRVKVIQFHQNYSYEDFIMGYRPDGADFKLTDGVFYQFCKTAENYPDKKFFFIIDEINRGNMSKIFGELMMLIEKDYRNTKLVLAYNGLPFSVPDNVFIIGMMNTADRSLAMIDYALRRRFSFFDIEPGFNTDGFKSYQKAFENDTFNDLIDQIKQLNKEIADDKSLGSGFQIGHSYFCGREELGVSEDWLRSVVEFDILPMLNEYWFDEPKKYKRWEENLHGVFDD